MTNPISPISSTPIQPLSIDFHAKVESRVQEEKKASESLSLYYTSTIISLQPPHQDQSADKITEMDATQTRSNKSVAATVKDCWDWVLSLFGAKKTSETVEDKGSNSDVTQNQQIYAGQPKLKEPDGIDKKKLAQMIAELNEHINRIKDMNEFEEEMRKTGSSSKSYRMDKIIINQYFAAAMRQKMSKEELGIEQQLGIFRRHQDNKQLQERFFSLWDEIRSRSKMTNILGWVNLGTTIGIAGAFAASFALTGPTAVIFFGLPALSLVKGVVSGAEGVMKYKNNLKTGELFAIQEESSEQSHQIKNGIENMRICDEDISQILKTVREQLKNQSDAERIFRSAAPAA